MKIYPSKLTSLLAAVALSLPLASCKQDYKDVEGATKDGFYSAPRQVYFEHPSAASTLSDYPYGVASRETWGIRIGSGELPNDITEVPVELPVRLAGPTSDTPLQFQLRIGEPIDYSAEAGDSSTADGEAEENNNPQPAISGVDFEPLEASYTIPAGQVSTTVSIRFKRSAVSQAESAGKELIVELVPTSDLNTGFATASNSYRIHLIDDLQMPIWWYYMYGNYFPTSMDILGGWTKEKHSALITQIGIEDWREINGGGGGNAYQPINIAKIARAVVALSQSHPELGFNPENARRNLP